MKLKQKQKKEEEKNYRFELSNMLCLVNSHMVIHFIGFRRFLSFLVFFIFSFFKLSYQNYYFELTSFKIKLTYLRISLTNV